MRDFQYEDDEFPDRYKVPGWPEYQWRKNIEFLEMLCLSKSVPLVHGPGPLAQFGIDPRNGAEITYILMRNGMMSLLIYATTLGLRITINSTAH